MNTMTIAIMIKPLFIGAFLVVLKTFRVLLYRYLPESRIKQILLSNV